MTGFSAHFEDSESNLVFLKAAGAGGVCLGPPLPAELGMMGQYGVKI